MQKYAQNNNMFRVHVYPIKRLPGATFKRRAIKAMPPRNCVLYCDVFNLFIKFK